MSSLRILFVDDDELIGMLTCVTLKRLGHAPEAFSNAADALAAFGAAPGRYHLVICDVRLDGGSGFELAAALRSLDARVPILMISGAVSDADRERAREAGALAVLPKSEVMTDLGAAIGRFARAEAA